MTSEEFRSNPLFMRNQFKGVGIFEMPVIQKQSIDLSNFSLIGFDHTKKADPNGAESYVHFFLDDYKFETIWSRPDSHLERLFSYKGVLSPQFSAYYSMPFSLQIYNTFRSRWCGAYLQAKGITVIPTVYWGLPQSYWYCFDGIEKGSVVALSTLGVRREKDFFMQGYEEMLRRLEPEAILCYSEPFPEMRGNVIVVDYAEVNNLNSVKKVQVSGDQQFFYKDNPYIVKKVGFVVCAGYGHGRKLIPIGARHGNTPGGNRRQNKAFQSVVTKLNLSPEQAQQLHYEISRMGYGYQEIYQIAEDMFGE